MDQRSKCKTSIRTFIEYTSMYAHIPDIRNKNMVLERNLAIQMPRLVA